MERRVLKITVVHTLHCATPKYLLSEIIVVRKRSALVWDTRFTFFFLHPELVEKQLPADLFYKKQTKKHMSKRPRQTRSVRPLKGESRCTYSMITGKSQRDKINWWFMRNILPSVGELDNNWPACLKWLSFVPLQAGEPCAKMRKLHSYTLSYRKLHNKHKGA